MLLLLLLTLLLLLVLILHLRLIRIPTNRIRRIEMIRRPHRGVVQRRRSVRGMRRHGNAHRHRQLERACGGRRRDRDGSWMVRVRLSVRLRLRLCVL